MSYRIRMLCASRPKVLLRGQSPMLCSCFVRVGALSPKLVNVALSIACYNATYATRTILDEHRSDKAMEELSLEALFLLIWQRELTLLITWDKMSSTLKSLKERTIRVLSLFTRAFLFLAWPWDFSRPCACAVFEVPVVEALAWEILFFFLLRVFRLACSLAAYFNFAGEVEPF